MPDVAFNNLSFGVNAYPLAQYNNTYQVLDNYSKVIGTHSLKFGGNLHYDQITQHTYGANNGSFAFDGSETGIDFADFLIGAPLYYQQGQQAPLHSRSRYYGLYAQDSWRITPALTLNYGLRWDVSTSWWEENNQLETIIPGEQSRSSRALLRDGYSRATRMCRPLWRPPTTTISLPDSAWPIHPRPTRVLFIGCSGAAADGHPGWIRFVLHRNRGSHRRVRSR